MSTTVVKRKVLSMKCKDYNVYLKDSNSNYNYTSNNLFTPEEVDKKTFDSKFKFDMNAYSMQTESSDSSLNLNSKYKFDIKSFDLFTQGSKVEIEFADNFNNEIYKFEEPIFLIDEAKPNMELISRKINTKSEFLNLEIKQRYTSKVYFGQYFNPFNLIIKAFN